MKIPEIKSMLELCLSKCYFIWNDEIHMLKDSGPIGLSIMVVMAEGFLQVLEAKAIDDALHLQPPLVPLSFYRYVDDSHSRFELNEETDKFLEVLNKQNTKIQYTMEKESPDKKLNFLELTTTNNGKGKYDISIYRKNAITNVQIKQESCHDPKILRGVFKGFVYRAITLCHGKYQAEEITFLMNVFQENGYDKRELEKLVQEVKNKQNQGPTEPTTNTDNSTEMKQTITLPWIPIVSPRLKKVYRKAGYKVVFKSGRNLSSILTTRNKMKLPENSFPGVYKIPCTCGITPYRGETKKKISTRIGEHEKDTEKKHVGKSGVPLHSSTCAGRIEFENAKTVAIATNRFQRKVRETLEIQKHGCHYTNGGMNQDKGLYVKTNFWLPLMKYLKKSEHN